MIPSILPLTPGSFLRDQNYESSAEIPSDAKAVADKIAAKAAAKAALEASGAGGEVVKGKGGDKSTGKK